MKYTIDKNKLENIFFKKGDIKLFPYNGYYFVWISNCLQLFKIRDDRLCDFFKMNEAKEQLSKSHYSIKELKKFRETINNIIENGIQKTTSTTNKNLNSITLNLAGNNCNLNCRYCFSYTDKKYMSKSIEPEVIKKAIGFLIQANPSPPNDTYIIRYFGGEPFLNIKMMNFTNKYCNMVGNTINKKFEFLATTNGTILTKSLMNMLKNRKLEIMISMDGPKNIHNKNRPFINGKGSYNKIIENLKKLDENCIDYSLRATIAPDCKNLVEIIQFFENLGKLYYFDFEVSSKFKVDHQVLYNDEIIESLDKQYKDICDFFFTKIKNNEIIYCENIYLSFSKLYFQQADLIFCTSGFTGVTINADGTVYSCQTVSNNIENNIGNISDGIDKVKLNKLISPPVEDIEKCNFCWCKYLCSGNCFADKIVEGISIYDCLEDRCKLTKMKWENYINLYIQVSDIKPSFFNSLNSLSYDNFFNHI